MAHCTVFLVIGLGAIFAGQPVSAGQLTRASLLGRWTHVDNIGMCSAPVDSVEQPFTLTETRIEALENSCDIKSWKYKSGFWEVNASCDGEGEAYENKYKFALTTDGDLSVIDEDSMVIMKRCLVDSLPVESKRECPLTKTIFQDLKSGRRFTAKRVARGCDTDSSNILVDPEHCDGASVMIIDGVLEGSEVVAVHQTWHAVPCCVWYSFNKKDATILNKVRNWLKEELVDTEMLGDDSDPIGEENYPWNPDPGPLGNGKYVPSFCFEN